MIPFLIGITGGSGSGKTYLSNKIVRHFGSETITIIQMDSYYKDLKHLRMADREKNNLRYKTTKFEGPMDGEIITRKAFDSEWNRA